MALIPKLSNTAANAACNAVVDLANNGYLRIYTTPKPATAETGGETTLLTELRFNATAFGDAALGIATANAITADTAINATGTAVWFRALASDGTTVLFDGSVGTGGCDLNLNTVALVENAECQVSSFTYTQSKG